MTEKQTFQPTRIVVDRETGAAIHPEGIKGYIDEMAQQATGKWQGIRELVPDLPALDMSPEDLVKEIMEQHPQLVAKVTMEEGKYPGSVRLRQS